MLRRLSHDRGAAMLFTLLFLVPLLISLILVINISWAWVIKRGVRAIADNAALAGASALAVPVVDPTATVNTVAGMTQVWAQAVTVSNISVGTWDGGTRTFTSTILANAEAVSVTIAVTLPYLINVAPWTTTTWQSRAIAVAEKNGTNDFVSKAYLVD